MSENEIFKLSVDEAEVEKMPWGTIRWLCNGKLVPESKQTFGYVTMRRGQRSGEHVHPNCEEIIYVAEGECDHYVDEKMVKLRKGDVIFLPENARHYAVNTGDEELVLIISYSSPVREIEGVER